MLAFEGKMDCVASSNPFGSKKQKPKQSIAEQRALFYRKKMDAWDERKRRKVAGQD